MSLKSLPMFEADAVGATETLQLFSEMAVIVSAFYGFAPSSQPISLPLKPDRKSFTFTVLPGTNFLTVTLFSGAKKSETATIYQDNPNSGALVDILVADHSGIGSLLIRGT